MAAKVTNMGEWKARRTEFPKIQIGCLNRAHREIVNFTIPAGQKNGRCPKCGRRAGRE